MRRRLVVRVIVAALASAALVATLAMPVPVGYVSMTGEINPTRGTAQLDLPFDYERLPWLDSTPAGNYSIRLIGPFGWTLADYTFAPLIPDGPRGALNLSLLSRSPGCGARSASPSTRKALS